LIHTFQDPIFLSEELAKAEHSTAVT